MSLKLSENGLRIFVAGILLYLQGCSGASQSASTDLMLPYNQYVYNYKNPYSVEEIAQANTYLEDVVRTLRLQHDLVVYFIPVESAANRLVFIRMHSGYEPSKETRKEINRKLEVFLNTLLKNRAAKKE